MIRQNKSAILLFLFLLVCPSFSHAVWIWTPQSGKFTNPKMAVRPTPAEQLEYALEFLNGKKYTQALGELKKLIKNYPRAKEVPEAQFYIGQIMEEMNKPFDAYKAYQVIIDKYPFSERSAQVVEIEFSIANQLLEGKSKRGKWIEVIIGGDDRVLEVFRTVIKNAPYGKYAAIAQYKIGLYLQEKGLYAEARDEFEKTINDYPDSEWAKAAQFQTAMADTRRSGSVQYEQKITGVALDEFKEFVKNLPDSELTPQAKQQISHLRGKEAENSFVIGQFYEKQKNYNSARVYYKDIIDRYSDTLWGPKAMTRLRMLGG